MDLHFYYAILVFTHTFIHLSCEVETSSSGAIWFSVLHVDTSAFSRGAEPPTLQLLDNPLYFVSYSRLY